MDDPKNNTNRNEYSQLDQSLIDTPPDTALPATKATPMMEVVAPANLPEGYTFPVEMPSSGDGVSGGGRTFTVTVPKGGIEEGQTFSVPLPGGPEAIDDSMMVPRISVPVGHWKDGLCDCFKYGCFHPLLWNAICCTPIAIAQVATRLNLNWCGRPGDITETAGTFQRVFYMVITCWVIDRLLILMMFGSIFEHMPADADEDYYEADGVFIFLAIVRKLLYYVYFIYAILFLKNTREYVRQKYAIPERDSCPKGCEDLCCSVFCTCCTLTQLARHTTDYDTYRGVCCSETGLPPHVPAIV